MTSSDTDYRSFDIKPYLLGAAPVYIDLLQEWQSQPALVSEAVLNRIIYRYGNLWLPLLAEWSTVELAPPLDVHWAWHLHMLNPQQYVDHCMSCYKKVLPHKIRLSDAEQKYALERTKLIWQDKYKNEPFDLDVGRANAGTYHLQEATFTCIQKTARVALDFAHQVSLPHYRDANFLFQALNRYKKFLALRRRHRDASVTLPVDVLLMWKVHTLYPTDYYHEALRPAGLSRICTDVDHDGRCLDQPGYNDQHWNALYSDPLLVPGSAYRGVPDYRSLQRLPQSHSAESLYDQCDIVLDELCIGELWSRDKVVTVVVRLLGNTSVTSKEILRLETAIDKVNRAANPEAGLVSFTFNTKENQGVEFDVYAVRSRCGCGRTEVHLNTMPFNPREPFDQAHFTTRDFLYEIPRISGLDPKVSFRCRLQAAAPEPHVLSLFRTPFAPSRKLPVPLTSFIQTLPKWRRAMETASETEEKKSNFMKATHELKSRDGSLDFGVEIIKQYDLDLGAVLIYHKNDNLVALAHSVGDETIASPSQLTGVCPLNLDPDADELAMSISNSDGEWAVCKGRWTYHTGGSRVKITIFFLKNGRKFEFDIRDDEMHTIQFGEVSIDMPSGRLAIDSRSRYVAENVALAFCVGIIYVSSQMRATVMATSRQNSVANLISNASHSGSVRSVKSVSELSMSDLEATVINPSRSTSRFTARRRNRKINRRRKMSASYTFLLASGLLIDLTLHGSTKAIHSPARTSLASLHMLYGQSENGSSGTGLSDATNNNNTGASYNSHYSPNGYAGNQTDSTDTSRRSNGSLPNSNGYNQISTSFAGVESNNDTEYMDVRL